MEVMQTTWEHAAILNAFLDVCTNYYGLAERQLE
jgi:hypothetical protein